MSGAGSGTVNAVKWALEAGYRLVDTASFYGNEVEVGRAVRESDVPREEVFVTTKLWNSDFGYDAAKEAFEESYRKLDLGYIDLYLLHWPVARLRRESWDALEEIYDSGRVKAIGVSNYTIDHLEELLGHCKIPPVVNQVEFHPLLFQKDLLEFCNTKNVRLEAYTPLTRREFLGKPVPVEIANKYGKTPAQIFIKWCLQHGVICIPKSSNRGRIKENADIFDFELSEEDMKRMDALNRDLHVTWDPTGQP
jgi:diketogulonate reductase-like aldo/keto reductase